MSSKIIDEDGDALDDRLVGDKKADKTALKDIAERVDNIRLVKLPISILESIYSDIEKDMISVTKRAKKIEEELHAQILKGNASCIEVAHDEMAHCK